MRIMNHDSPKIQPKKISGTIFISNEKFNINKQAVPSQEAPDSNEEIVHNLKKSASMDLFKLEDNEPAR